MEDKITRTIFRVIIESGALNVAARSLGEQDDLYMAGLKSLAAVRLMVALEEEFGIEFPSTALHRSAFSTVERIRDVIAPLVTGVLGAN